MSANTSPALPVLADIAMSDRDERLRRSVDDHYLFVWRSLQRLGIPEAEADDLAQEVFLLFVQKLDGIEPGLERRFLFRSAVHLAMHAKRSFRRRRTFEERSESLLPSEPVPSAEEGVERREDLVLLDALLAELPEELRTIVVLCELEDMTMNEAASVLGIPPGTAASRLRRGREALLAGLSRRETSKP